VILIVSEQSCIRMQLEMLLELLNNCFESREGDKCQQEKLKHQEHDYRGDYERECIVSGQQSGDQERATVQYED
jgi:hypothetical protein